eukprot:m.237239 g.237239  ORF g.237239 m.237239 type:complete len:114 (-) comp19366_c0_seq2:1400-1741(-)
MSASKTRGTLLFKNPAYRKRNAKRRSLKQILATMSNQTVGNNAATFLSIAAPPSEKLKLRYSDVSGLKFRYRHPRNNLYFSNVEEYERINRMSPLEIREHLAFRGIIQHTLYK